MSINAEGRQYVSGKALSVDLRNIIVEAIIEAGGNKVTGIVPRGVYTRMGKRFKVSRQGITKIWMHYVSTGSTKPKDNHGNQVKKLLEGDIVYLESLKTQRPGITAKEMRTKLSLVSQTSVSESTIKRAVRQRFTGGIWTYKRNRTVARERYTLPNLRYTQAYIDLLYTIDPRRLKFMDESGFKTPGLSRPNYGHSLIGTRSIEMIRYHQSPNTTLNLLVGLDGIMHAQTIAGASDSVKYLDFITESVDSVTEIGQQALQPGDVLVVDNCPTHHSEVAQVLNTWLAAQGIEVIYTPKYSPEFNPAENCFSKVKHCIQNDPVLAELTYENMPLAIFSALDLVTPGDLRGFYRHTGYLNVN
ncbi:uncharacterized protein LOC144434190 [Glandiceps talaboti]